MADSKRPTNSLTVTGEIIENDAGRLPFGTQTGLTSWRSRRQLSNSKADELSAKLHTRLQAVQHALGRQLDVTKKQIDVDADEHKDRIIAQAAEISAKLSQENLQNLSKALIGLGDELSEGVARIESTNHPDKIKENNIDTLTTAYELSYKKIRELYGLD